MREGEKVRDRERREGDILVTKQLEPVRAREATPYW